MPTMIGIREVQDKIGFLRKVTVSINTEKMPDFFAGVVYLDGHPFAVMDRTDNEIKQLV